MTSYHPEILSGDRFWVDLSKKTIVVEIRQSSCLLNFGTDTLLFDFNLEKKHQAKRKSMNQTLFSTKSITLNPMVQSDLVTYMGVTLLILFLKATITRSSPSNRNVPQAPLLNAFGSSPIRFNEQSTILLI